MLYDVRAVSVTSNRHDHPWGWTITSPAPTSQRSPDAPSVIVARPLGT